jgi:hypothetical protein
MMVERVNICGRVFVENYTGTRDDVTHMKTVVDTTLNTVVKLEEKMWMLYNIMKEESKLREACPSMEITRLSGVMKVEVDKIRGEMRRCEQRKYFDEKLSLLLENR